MEKIIVTSPKPFQEIGAEFKLIGSVPMSFLVTSWGGTDMRLFTNYIDIDGKTFMGGTVYVRALPKLLRIFSSRALFGQVERFSQFNVAFIEKSQGRITLKISGHEKVDPIYIPLIIKEFEPPEGVDPDIQKRHPRVGEMIQQYEQDLKNYYKEFEEIQKSRKAKEEGQDGQHLYGQSVGLATDILKILDESDESFDNYDYSEEDQRERELEEKYKDALDWRGPLLKGVVSQFAGFELRVYSDDHGKHFHVVHKGKGINARFSFPDMQLINYAKGRNTISSKQEQKIREYCLQPEIFSRFTEEFDKRTK